MSKGSPIDAFPVFAESASEPNPVRVASGHSGSATVCSLRDGRRCALSDNFTTIQALIKPPMSYPSIPEPQSFSGGIRRDTVTSLTLQKQFLRLAFVRPRSPAVAGSA
jgi:hypothetical protein